MIWLINQYLLRNFKCTINRRSIHKQINLNMMKIFNFFNEKIVNYFSNSGDKASIVSFSGGWTDILTILGLMLVWSIGYDILNIEWLFDFKGILVAYLIARIFAISIVAFVLPEKLIKNQQKRYLKAKFILFIPFLLIFFLAFFSRKDFSNAENNWEGPTKGLFD